MNNTQKLIDFIAESPTAYHAVSSVRDRLLSMGYTELYESDAWMLKDGGKYFVTRGGSSLIAFRHNTKAEGFLISAAHSDSPAFRIKMTAEQSAAAYTRLETERYGGMLQYTWFDRPLSVAGRVMVKRADGIETCLVDLKEPVGVIPSVAIHFNRNANDGFSTNAAVDLLPVSSLGAPKDSLMKRIAKCAHTEPENILSHDLYLYNTDRGVVFGTEGEMLLCPRLDDLACVFGCLMGFLHAKPTESLPVLAIFDNEEVGSSTAQGAASTFLSYTLERIGGESPARMYPRSLMVSADNAHAVHPNHPELSDRDHAPKMGSGIAIKYNANRRYTTDGYSDALFRTVCERAGVPTQSYYNRADLPGGSTLGNIANNTVSVPTLDIGIPQLAMHSANETCAVADVDSLVSAMTEFYSSTLKITDNIVKI